VDRSEGRRYFRREDIGGFGREDNEWTGARTKEDIFCRHARVPKFGSLREQLAMSLFLVLVDLSNPYENSIFLYWLIKSANTKIKAQFWYRLQFFFLKHDPLFSDVEAGGRYPAA
jgi:hypothetical protein